MTNIPSANLGYLRPKNEDSEKEKLKHFWQQSIDAPKRGKIYNPKFTYADSHKAYQTVNDMKCIFSQKYVHHAKAILDEVIRRFDKVETYKNKCRGRPIDCEETIKVVHSYLNENNLHVNVQFSKILITNMSAKGLTLVDTPYFYRDPSFKALLDHEIGTHYIRTLNQKNLDPKIQAHLKKVQRGWMLSAEEGLASIATHMPYTKCDLFFNPALNYFAACTAMENDFWSTFKILFKYTTGFDECWNKTLRVKRGLSDTSKPGAYCKDQCSLDGLLRILKERERINFPAFFAGKVSLETYFDSEDLLIQASQSSSFLMPPHLRGKVKYDYFMSRVNEMYQNHQELFMRTRSISGV